VVMVVQCASPNVDRHVEFDTKGTLIFQLTVAECHGMTSEVVTVAPIVCRSVEPSGENLHGRSAGVVRSPTESVVAPSRHPLRGSDWRLLLRRDVAAQLPFNPLSVQ
jgi:hypothetical protein